MHMHNSVTYTQVTALSSSLLAAHKIIALKPEDWTEYQ